MTFPQLPKLKQGDKVAILSPSFAGPAIFPDIYQLGLKRLTEIFNLEPVEYPTTSKLSASKEERSKDLISAFEDKEIKAIFTTIGGDDQVTYVKNLPSEPFKNNPKPFFGFSDNTHFMNHLWLSEVPSFYGAGIMTQFAMQSEMDSFTIEFIKHALFESGEFELRSSENYNDIGLDWGDLSNLNKSRTYEKNDGWYWDGGLAEVSGISWGGCLESIDEMLRHNIEIPTLEQFENIVLFLETSEEIPDHAYVRRVIRALGERCILKKIKGLMVGRPKAWEFDKQNGFEAKKTYREGQRETITKIVREYNQNISIVQNLDFGHTDPQICLPMGSAIRISPKSKQIWARF